MSARAIFLFILLLFTSCQQKSADSSPASQPESEKPPSQPAVVHKSCYEGSRGTNLFWLHIEVAHDSVSGMLAYQAGKKDKVQGALKGEMHGDTLWADCAFNTGGVINVREVLFLIYNNLAIEGYGPMKKQNGKVVFENKRNTDFGGGVSLPRVECISSPSADEYRNKGEVK